jgi:hypothetical protein
MDVDVNFYNHGFYLEWTWELFWNRCFQNTPIKLYNDEKILFAFQLDKKNNFVNDITNNVIDELNKNNHFKVTDSVKIIISKNKIVKINSVFSPSPYLSSLIQIKENNKRKEILIKPQSTFKIFFNIFIDCIKKKKLNFFINNMLFDAKFREIVNNQLR